MTIHPHIIFSRIDHRNSHYRNCECQQCTPTLYDMAMQDPELARELFDASKGGNVPGITENHRFALADFFQRGCSSLRVGEPIYINEDYGTETSVVRVYADTLVELRRYVRENNPGSIPIYSPYDCTGLVCGQYAKFIKIWRTHGGYTALVEFSITRDV